ncbi:30S ribosomal protein S4 [Candidatus Woesearchaeota archaeon]|jgi:small subunit ribosomal protein S4|nr:30S ribosomal protein S4 [Candidatus Woesearchaeota archaeon]MBT5740274.1 30S ribosomal protein S4 [Candidatus Woesearchaeota archaeon]
MGDPRKFRKTYSTPVHPWNKATIEEERKVMRDYGLSKKQEIFKANSFLKKYKDLAKRLIADNTQQGQKEKAQITEKLQKLGLIQPGAELGSVLGLLLKDVLERRLQSVVFRKSLARSMKQARQFITHRHVSVAGKEITSPAYITSLSEEAQLGFKEKSSLASETHPERVSEEKEIHKEAEEVREHIAKATVTDATVNKETVTKPTIKESSEKVVPVEKSEQKEVPTEKTTESKEPTKEE